MGSPTQTLNAVVPGTVMLVGAPLSSLQQQTAGEGTSKLCSLDYRCHKTKAIPAGAIFGAANTSSCMNKCGAVGGVKLKSVDNGARLGASRADQRGNIPSVHRLGYLHNTRAETFLPL